MAPQSYQLVMRSGPKPGEVFELNKNEISIGRDIANDIVINDAEVSRKHARLIAQPEGGYLIEDTGSTNGTFVAGQRLMSPYPLRPGDVVLFGENVSLSFEGPRFDADATMIGSAAGAPSVPPEAAPPSPRPSYNPPPQSLPTERQAPPPEPVYSAPPPMAAPPGPVEVFSAPEETRRPNRNLLYAGCGCLLLVLCVLVAGAWAFDSLNLYCTPPFNTLFACPPVP